MEDVKSWLNVDICGGFTNCDVLKPLIDDTCISELLSVIIRPVETYISKTYKSENVLTIIGFCIKSLVLYPLIELIVRTPELILFAWKELV
jgi:hypothetical protein